MNEKAYAKVNLFLSVGDKLADGYHEIDTVMHTVSLCDDLVLMPDDAVSVECSVPIPEKQNLAYLAAVLFFRETGVKGGAKIKIFKRIPARAGLGGGSADAAAVLRGLNRMYKTGIPESALAAMGLWLGSDVPFCVYGGKARCLGTGGLITPLPRERLNIVIAKPEEDCSTPEMYRLLDGNPPARAEYSEGIYFNSFDTVCPEQSRALKESLLSLGASAAMLSGSGSAVFGVFPTRESAAAAADSLRESAEFVFRTETV